MLGHIRHELRLHPELVLTSQMTAEDKWDIYVYIKVKLFGRVWEEPSEQCIYFS